MVTCSKEGPTQLNLASGSQNRQSRGLHLLGSSATLVSMLKARAFLLPLVTCRLHSSRMVSASAHQKRSMVKIGTHSGKFHCDEALGCYLLKQTDAYKDADVTRTRDEAVLKDLDVVIDVGGKYDPGEHTKVWKCNTRPLICMPGYDCEDPRMSKMQCGAPDRCLLAAVQKRSALIITKGASQRSLGMVRL